jgi:TRAP-type C4-dicarboxylate transport system substrate-binding protein
MDVRHQGRRGGRRAAVALAAAGALLLGACSTAGAGDADDGEAASEPVTLTFQEIYAPGNMFADSDVAFADYARAYADDSLDFEFYWSSAIVPSNEIASAMNDGLVDLGRIQPPASPADYPVMNWLSSASSLNVQAFPGGLLQKVGAHLEFVMNSEHGTPQLDAELSNLGIRPLAGFAIVQQYDMFCSRPVTSLADFQGLKVRVAGQAWIDEIENLGGTAVALIPEEIYEAYQRGVVDCVMTYPTHYVDSGLWELGGYYVPLKLNGWNQDALTISNGAWEELDETQREAMHAGVRVWLEQLIKRQLDGYWQFVAEGADHGVEYPEIDPAVQTQVDAHHEAVIAGLEESAPANVEDPGAMLEEYVDLHAQWRDIVSESGFDVEGQGVNEFLDSLDDPTVPPSEQVDLDPWLDALMERAYGL